MENYVEIFKKIENQGSKDLSRYIDNIKIGNDSLSEIENEIIKDVEDIPFENSFGQTETVVNDQLTPARAYRNLSLRFLSQLNKFKQHIVERRKANIGLRKLNREIEFLKEDKDNRFADLEIEEKELEIESLKSGESFNNKLVNDMLAELNHLHSLFNKLPKYNREEFEKEEHIWLKLKMSGVKHLPLTNLLEGDGQEWTKNLTQLKVPDEFINEMATKVTKYKQLVNDENKGLIE